MVNSSKPQWEREEHTRFALRKAQSPRSFQVLLASVAGMILLTILVTVPLNLFIRILLLMGLVSLAFIGMILMDQHKTVLPQESDIISAPLSPDNSEEENDHNNQESIEEETLTPFEQLVQEALDSIPEEFHEQMENLIIIVEQKPDPETLRQIGHRHSRTLLGLYQGVPLTSQSYQYTTLPEQITIYQKNIEAYCNHDPDRIREQVKATVLHEVAHHFGMGHEEMPIWIR